MLFLKRKSKIKLSDLTNAIKNLAEELGNKHWEVHIIYSTNWFTNELDSGKGVYFQAYIADHGIHTALSIKELVDKFKNPPSKESQVKEIEI